jgi:hypothetical protein
MAHFYSFTPADALEDALKVLHLPLGFFGRYAAPNLSARIGSRARFGQISEQIIPPE